MATEFTWTAEQDELRSAVRDFAAAAFTEADVRREMDSPDGFDRRIWGRLAGELGLTGLAVPAEFGGFGGGPVELGIAFEELGRVLGGGPLFTVAGLAVPALLHGADREGQKEFLPGIAAGETLATLALGGTVDAVESGPDWTLTGEVSFVPDAMAADLILVAAGQRLFAVPAGAAGLSREPLSLMDQTRRQARLTFRSVQARLIGSDGLTRALDEAAAYLAASSVGGAQRVLDMAVQYAKTRYQFGRPIGSYQAIKHRAADLLASVESARSVAYHACWAAADDPAELPLAAALARAFCSEVFVEAALANVQMHGGIGFTWEHPAHLYVKRAISDRALLGNPDQHRERLADLAGL